MKFISAIRSNDGNFLGQSRWLASFPCAVMLWCVIGTKKNQYFYIQCDSIEVSFSLQSFLKRSLIDVGIKCKEKITRIKIYSKQILVHFFCHTLVWFIFMLYPRAVERRQKPQTEFKNKLFKISNPKCWQKWLIVYMNIIIITRSTSWSVVRHPDNRIPEWNILEGVGSVTVLLVNNSESMICARNIFSIL